MIDKTHITGISKNARVYPPKQRVEICRNCHGSGSDELHNFCPVCNGTGRIVKTITVSIEVKPYEQES